MAETAVGNLARRLPNFRLGKKKVFLPSHVITFLRRDNQPPNWAHFEVPLTFTKFDLRDYLWNLYGVETTKVRSAVQQHKVERRQGGRGALYRPPPTKYMTAELTRPFVWPEVPADLQPWNKDLWDAREKSGNLASKTQRARHEEGNIGSPSKDPITFDRRELRQRAQKYLNGQLTWETDAKLDEKWRTQGGAEKK
ncbi:hypothetical protein SODALDRAFT_330403 [Sodiomyces alkalinus F11]|uniref:Large ribosomal subunit protein uL23m n=1 Tax=Sodiomyces alkalinus (strain CBS 110278 / VKM F-3762 / F11) TaxID=1314773 RepID=A0A3N2Q1M6_SODAK|nr:hypothetical protein SODALDRAFT_330403 [Sodiomyces alkalinus F11]ROT40661.1 hypothetical protein SODALDRAFT_330403 [Sodiomyces alkalinus F11]